MRAKFIYEKFTEEGDPIHDMGIGIEYQIEEWLNNERVNSRYPWSVPIVKQTDRAINYLIHNNGKKEYIDYLINSRNDYNKNDALSSVLNSLHDNKKDIVDNLLKQGAKFSDLLSKATYIKKGGKLASLTPEEELMISCKTGDIDKFKLLIKQGIKVTMEMIYTLFQDNNYYTNKPNEKKEILHFLYVNKSKLKNIIHSKDHKKLHKIEELLIVSIKTKKHAKYPHGYKIYRILKFIDENHPPTRKDITIFIVELTFGKGSYNPLKHGSYWTDGFKSIIYPNIISKNGYFELNDKGKEKLKKLHAKFSKMDIKAYI